MENEQQNLAVTANRKRGARTCNGLLGRCKLGWNWLYAFAEKVMPDGIRRTLVVEYMLHHRASGTDVVISNYPGGRPYEDAAAEAIADVFRDFFGEALEMGVVWKEVRHSHYLTGWLINAPIDSEIIRTFAAALASINRVTVEMKLTEEAK